MMMMMLRKIRCWLSPSSPYAHAFYPQQGDDPILDGLRGISILLIILFHSFYGAAYVLRDVTRIEYFLNQVPPILTFAFTAEKAVDIFFLVSGFLLGKSLCSEWARRGGINIKRFYVRRLFRIVPLFYVALVLYSPINWHRSLKNLWVNLLFIDNFWGKMIVPVGWSLSIEMQFYFILPFLVLFLMARSRPLLWLSAGVVFAYVVQAMVCLSVPQIYQTPFSSFITKQVNPDIFMVNYYYPTHVRFGPLLMGLIWAWCSLNADILKRVWPKRLATFSWVLGVVSVTAILFGSYFPSYQSQSYFNQQLTPTMNFWAMVLHRNTYALGWLGLMLVVHVMQDQAFVWAMCRNFLSIRFWRPFSQAVFPMYLFHFPMIIIAGFIVLGRPEGKMVAMLSVPQVFAIFIIASALSLGMGLVLHFGVEMPFIRWGKRLTSSSTTSK